MSSISRVLRARFGSKFEESDFDKKKHEEEEQQRRTKHSIDGILADKGESPAQRAARSAQRAAPSGLNADKLGVNGLMRRTVLWDARAPVCVWGVSAMSLNVGVECACATPKSPNA